MSYRTINLKPETYDRLVEYKSGGKSFDDVIAGLMDLVPEGRYRVMTARRRAETAPERRSTASFADARDDSPDELGAI